MPCDSDGFVSVVSLRDPIERTFAGDGMWKTFANGTNMDMCSSDNYGLRKLIDKPLPANLSWEDVEFAKRRLASFDLIIDQGNYATSMKLLCAELGLSYCGVAQKVHRYPSEYLPDDIFKKLRHRNRFELAMYEYGQELSRDMIRSSQLAGRWPANATLKSLQRAASQLAGRMPADANEGQLLRYALNSCPRKGKHHPRRAWVCPSQWPAHD
mmetsp:Transcript_102273/g.270155  ORF Transcript_102273/g.270155 Transcript_102273/m.270155 type:complete len:212 (+) Transcript_102273:564-1199(+)